MGVLLAIVMFFWSTFALWLKTLFVYPFLNLEIFWILAPVYISLVLTELFQEKKGTSKGNATSNSVIVLWGGIDFLRITINSISAMALGMLFGVKILVAVLLIAYGGLIIYMGAKSMEAIKYIARIREVSYCIIVFAPLFYTDISLSGSFILAMIIYFPLFYWGLEVIDKFLPDPKAFVEDVQDAAADAPKLLGKDDDLLGGF